jgi:clan AA aspartic protease
MGVIHTTVQMTNPRKPELRPVDVEVLVDTGAVHFCIPEHIALQLELEEFDKREVTVADGRRRIVSYVGPISVAFENRKCLTGAMVLGDKALLGAIPMEDMDLVFHPAQLKVMVNPQSPNIAMAMGFQE